MSALRWVVVGPNTQAAEVRHYIEHRSVLGTLVRSVVDDVVSAPVWMPNVVLEDLGVSSVTPGASAPAPVDLKGVADLELWVELQNRGQPDVANVAAILHVDPDRAASAMSECKVAGPWCNPLAGVEGFDPTDEDSDVRFVRASFGTDNVAEVDFEPGVTSPHSGRVEMPPTWGATALGHSLGSFATRAEAMHAVDAALVEDGWALAGGAR